MMLNGFERQLLSYLLFYLRKDTTLVHTLQLYFDLFVHNVLEHKIFFSRKLSKHFIYFYTFGFVLL